MKNEKNFYLFKKILLLIISYFIMAFGVALSTKADLGVSPISSAIYVFSLYFPITLGQMTIIFHVCFILLQIIILGKDFKFFQLTQILAAFIFGYFTDFSVWAMNGINPYKYWEQWILCLLSCVLIAVGVYLEIKANLLIIAGEGLVLAISIRFRIDFGKVKLGFDCAQVILGVIFSFIVFHELNGIREGTVVSALLIGNIVKLLNKYHFADIFLQQKDMDSDKKIKNEY